MGADKIRRELVNTFIRPSPNCRILDIGCGTAEILHYLPSGVEYWGYDISPEYIRAAKRRFGDRGRFQCSHFDKSALAVSSQFDVVLAIGVLHHLEDHIARNIFDVARSALRDKGRVITIDPCFTEKQNAIAQFLIRNDRGRNVRCSDGYRSLAAGSFTTISGTIRHRKWVPYTHWIMECSK